MSENSHVSHEAAKASSPEASIPNADAIECIHHGRTNRQCESDCRQSTRPIMNCLCSGLCDRTLGRALSSTSRPLLLGSALSAPKAHGTRSDWHPSNAVLLADRSFAPGVSAVVASMLHRIDRFDMLRSAAGRIVAFVMDVFARRPMQRFVHQAMHAPHPPLCADETVAVGVLAPTPNPAFSSDNETGVEAHKGGISEHSLSIQNAGFTASPCGLPSTIAGEA